MHARRLYIGQTLDAGLQPDSGDHNHTPARTCNSLHSFLHVGMLFALGTNPYDWTSLQRYLSVPQFVTLLSHTS